MKLNFELNPNQVNCAHGVQHNPPGLSRNCSSFNTQDRDSPPAEARSIILEERPRNCISLDETARRIRISDFERRIERMSLVQQECCSLETLVFRKQKSLPKMASRVAVRISKFQEAQKLSEALE